MSFLNRRALFFLMVFVVNSILLSSFALASGGDSSGGGNALVCFDDESVPFEIRKNGGNLSSKFIPHIVSVETYDLYAAKKAYGEENLQPFDIVNGFGTTPIKYATFIYKRLQSLVPKMSDEIQKSKNLTPVQQIYMQPFGIFKVDDVEADAPYDVKHCVLATMASHYYDNGSYFLHIDERLFMHPSHRKLSQAVLLLHEFVYMAGRRQGHESSKETRSLVGMMLRQKTGMTARQWVDWVNALGFNGTEKFYGYPGETSFTALLQMFKLADMQQKAFSIVFENPLVISTNQRLAAFKTRCENDNVTSCLLTLERLLSAKVAGGEKLMDLVPELLRINILKIKEIDQEIGNYLKKVMLPKFKKLPYGDEGKRTVLAEIIAKETLSYIINLNANDGNIDTSEGVHRERMLEFAHKIAFGADQVLGLDTNPLEPTLESK